MHLPFSGRCFFFGKVLVRFPFGQIALSDLLVEVLRESRGCTSESSLNLRLISFFSADSTMEDNSEQLEKLVQKFVIASGPDNRPTHEAGVEELQRMAALRYVARRYILALLFIESYWSLPSRFARLSGSFRQLLCCTLLSWYHMACPNDAFQKASFGKGKSEATDD